jgi:hypothetical protein
VARYRIAELNGEDGFPHSEICGSKVAHTSPQLIAACHVLHRLCMPRHPPNALTSRLRVHTTNDNAGHGHPSEDIRSITCAAKSNADKFNLSLKILISNDTIIPFRRKKIRYRHGIDFKNPFTMSKRGQIPHIANRSSQTVVFISGKMVEPNGFEPLT